MNMRPTTERGRLYKTTQGMVAGELREGILSGVLKGGQPLRQTEIARALQGQPHPRVRGFTAARGRGTHLLLPHPGVVVSELYYEQAREISEIRVALETMPICKEIPLLSEEEPERAEEVLDTIYREDDLLSR
jgi:DNA-binding GntR family transcriptional regulator